MTAGTVASRITGLIRVLAVTATLGTTYLGNTYQTANLVSNLLFELLAAGVLSSVLVPPFVRLLDSGNRAEAERLAGALLGVALVVLSSVVGLALITRGWIMTALTVAVADPGIRAAERRLGSYLLLLFLPQVLLYAVGAVATALLQADRRFASSAYAPVANNAVVILTMGVFWWMEGTNAGLNLGGTARFVLAFGTTGGVVAMTIIPLVGLRRAGLSLRPRWEPSLPALRAIGRGGAWGAVQLAGTQVLLGVTLVLANRVAGGVVAYHLAFTVFLLPFAVLAYPVLTTSYPALVSAAGAERWADYSRSVRRRLRVIVVRVAPASVALVVFGGPILALARLGAFDDSGARLAAPVVAAYGLGLIGYSSFQYLIRAFYATGDVRTPALVTLGVAAAGSVLMVVGDRLLIGDRQVVVLGLSHSVAMTGGAVLLAAVLRHKTEVRMTGGSG